MKTKEILNYLEKKIHSVIIATVDDKGLPVTCAIDIMDGDENGLYFPLQKLFEKNPYMNEIYPTEKSRQALTVFQLYEGSGEWFDLSQKPIERASFTIGNEQTKMQGYEITHKCNGCKACQSVCPQNCIDFTIIPAVIRQENCLHCGNCLSICPQKAVIRRG